MAPKLDSSLFERIGDGIFVLDRLWTYVYVNAAGARLVGRSVDELVGRVVWEVFPEAVGSAFERNFRYAADNQELVEFEDYFPPLDRWYAIRVFPSADGLTIVLRDSSARHVADRALEALLAQSRREQRLAAVLAETNEAVFRATSPQELFDAAVRIAVDHGGFVMSWIGILDPGTGDIAHVASAGEGADEYLAVARVTSRDGPYGRGVAGLALRSGAPMCSNDILEDDNMAPWRGPAARVGYRSSGAFPLIVGGDVAGLMSVYAAEPRYFDTEEISLVRRLAANVSYGWESLLREAALRDSEVARRTEQRFREVLSAAPTAILGVGGHRCVEFANGEAGRLFARPSARLVGERVDALLHPIADGPGIEGLITELETDPRPITETTQLCGRRGDDSAFPAEVAVSRVGGEAQGGLVLVSVHDLSERLELEAARRLRALEAERERADRLDSLGKLAGGVAHDFNNLLGIILNYTTLLERHLDDAQVRSDLNKIRVAAQRGAELTRQLLTFARRDPATPKPIDVNESVRSVAAMLDRGLGPGVELVLQLAAEPLVAVIDRQQLDQVILNLVLNARDAMPGGGRVLVSTAPASAAAGRAAGPPHGETVEIRVSDTGFGMTPEVAARAFEPFFTTKPRGQGTGLGLAAVYGIVERSGGRATIDSTPAIGTTVTVELPRCDTDAQPGPPAPPLSTPVSGREECVLLVEDDEDLREATKRILRGAGFRVLDADDGIAALEVFAANREVISVVLSDVIMPRMRGDELARVLGTRAPELRVVLMTGHDSGEVPLSEPVLRKPVDEERLVRALREVLDA